MRISDWSSDVCSSDLELGGVRLITNTSWFDREKLSVTDYSYHTIEGTSYILSNFFVGNPSLTIHNLFPPAYTAPSNFVSIQKSFPQEARLQSADTEAALRWTIGGCYQRSEEPTSELQTTMSNSSDDYS